MLAWPRCVNTCIITPQEYYTCSTVPGPASLCLGTSLNIFACLLHHPPVPGPSLALAYTPFLLVYAPLAPSPSSSRLCATIAGHCSDAINSPFRCERAATRHGSRLHCINPARLSSEYAKAHPSHSSSPSLRIQCSLPRFLSRPVSPNNTPKSAISLHFSAPLRPAHICFLNWRSAQTLCHVIC